MLQNSRSREEKDNEQGNKLNTNTGYMSQEPNCLATRLSCPYTPAIMSQTFGVSLVFILAQQGDFLLSLFFR